MQHLLFWPAGIRLALLTGRTAKVISNRKTAQGCFVVLHTWASPWFSETSWHQFPVRSVLSCSWVQSCLDSALCGYHYAHAFSLPKAFWLSRGLAEKLPTRRFRRRPTCLFSYCLSLSCSRHGAPQSLLDFEHWCLLVTQLLPSSCWLLPHLLPSHRKSEKSLLTLFLPWLHLIFPQGRREEGREESSWQLVSLMENSWKLILAGNSFSGLSFPLLSSITPINRVKTH